MEHLATCTGRFNEARTTEKFQLLLWVLYPVRPKYKIRKNWDYQGIELPLYRK